MVCEKGSGFGSGAGCGSGFAWGRLALTVSSMYTYIYVVGVCIVGLARTVSSMSTVRKPLLSVMTTMETRRQPREKSAICSLRESSCPKASVANSPSGGRLGTTSAVR